MRLNRYLARGSVATVAFAFAAVLACSGNDRGNGVDGDGFRPPPTQSGPCTPGQVRDCGIELGRDDKVVDCAKGTQTCLEDKSWGACIANGTTFKAHAPAPSAGSPDPQLGTNAVGGSSSTCTDNPCNPYCKTFNDSPDTGVTSDATTTTTPGGIVLLENSNVPGGFQNKGTLDSQCAGDPTSVSYKEACQFDMRCGTKKDGTAGCVPFVSGEKNACTGIDITAPPVCVSNAGDAFRNLTICNRGSADLTSNVVCMGYPGNSPHYPDSNPGAGDVVLNTASTVDPTTGTTNPITGAKPIKAGECRTFKVPNGSFKSNGTTSVMCNPPATGTPVTSTLDSVGSIATSTEWTDPNNALSDTDSTASATTTMTRAAMTGAFATTVASTNFSPTASAQGATDGSFATATLAISSVTRAPGALSSSTNAGGACSSFAASSGSLQSALATVDTAYANWSVRKNCWAEARFDSGLGGAVPAGCTPRSMTLTANWSRTDASDSLSASVIIAGTSYPMSFSSATTTATWPDISYLAPADFAGSQIVIAGSRGNVNGSGTAQINNVSVTVNYTCGSEVSLTASGFSGFGTLPPGATIDGFGLETVWRVGKSSGVYLQLTPTKSDGTVLATSDALIPAGYAAGSAISSTNVWGSSTPLTEAELAGLRFTVKGIVTGDAGSVGVDSLKLVPRYRTNPDRPVMEISKFGFSVPAGATNVQLTIFANAKTTLTTGDDWLRVVSSAGHSGWTTLSNSFTTYATSTLTLADPTLADDANLKVQVYGYKSRSSLTTSTESVDWVRARLQYTSTVSGSVAECNPYNNWTVNKANPATVCDPTTVTVYPPWTVSRVFDGACPVGSRPRWKYFGYTSTTPTGTKIEFRFRASARDATGACPTLGAATADPPGPLATAQKTATVDTQVCSLSAAPTASCPVDLTSGLGAANSRLDCLQMDARGVPAALPPASPTLTDWRVTYDCVPEE